MGSGNSQNLTKHHPMNIFVCGNILDLLIDTTENSNYVLNQGHKQYIHPELHWYFTPVLEGEVINILKNAIDGQESDKQNIVVILPVKTIFCNKVYDILKGINNLSTLYHPFLLLVTEQDQSKDLLIQTRKGYFSNFDSRNVFVIRSIDKDIREIYMRLFKICSYYHQLGDELAFPLSVNLSNMVEENDIVQSGKNSKIVLFESNFTHRINFLVIGRPGAGKSAFINKLLGEKRCLEKAGKSVTSTILKYNHPDYPIGIFDTPGFEDENNMEAVFGLIQKMNKKLTEEQLDIIHMVIYLINSQDERTLFNTEEEFFKKILNWSKKNLDKDIGTVNESKRKLPLIFVYTHGVNKKKSDNKKVILNANLKSIFNEDYTKKIFPVELFEEDGIQTFGMGRLFEYLHNYFIVEKIPNEVFARIGCLDKQDEEEIYKLLKPYKLISKIKSKEDIKIFCRYLAGGIIGSTTTIATAIGASPIPFSDWFILTSVQVSMIIAIGTLYGFQFNKNEAFGIMKSLGFSGVSAGVCSGVASGLKCIPGVGTIAGIVIDSVVCAAGTASIGFATIAFCEKKLDEIGIKEFYLKAISEYNLAIDSMEEIKGQFKY